jgi:hypothetical protein
MVDWIDLTHFILHQTPTEPRAFNVLWCDDTLFEYNIKLRGSGYFGGGSCFIPARTGNRSSCNSFMFPSKCGELLCFNPSTPTCRNLQSLVNRRLLVAHKPISPLVPQQPPPQIHPQTMTMMKFTAAVATTLVALAGVVTTVLRCAHAFENITT